VTSNKKMSIYTDSQLKTDHFLMTYRFLMTIRKFREAIDEEHRPSWIKISTITMVSSHGKNINYQKLRDIFTKLDTITLNRKDSSGPGFTWKYKPSTKFMNQMTIWYKDVYSTKSIKVFSNGSLQAAGCADVLDCMRVIDQLNYLFKTLGVIDEDTTISNYRIAMINTNFSVNYHVNLMKIIEYFSKSPIFEVEFEPDNYSAVVIMFKPAQDMNQATVSIFGTGKIIITGLKNLQEVSLAYNIIVQNINAHKDEIKVAKNPWDCNKVFMGYDLDDWFPALEKVEAKPWTFSRINKDVVF